MPEGRVARVPDDGMSTRQRRNRPLLMVHTGDGKGKSTAAFGLALRGWNQGWSIGVFQFVKSAKWRIGEQSAFETLGEVHGPTGQGGPMEWHKMGSGWSWSRKSGDEEDHAAEPARAGAEIKRRLAERDPRPVRVGRIHLSDQLGLGRRRRRGGDADRAVRGASTWSSPVAVRIPRSSPRRAGDRNDQDQPPLRPRPEGSAGYRVVTHACRPPPRGDRRAGFGARQDDRGQRADGRVAGRGLGGGRFQDRTGLHRPGVPHAGHRSSRAQPGPLSVSARSTRAAAEARVSRPPTGRRGGDRGCDGPVRRSDRDRRIRLDGSRGPADQRAGGTGAGHLPPGAHRRRGRARPEHLRTGSAHRRGDPQQGRLAAARR